MTNYFLDDDWMVSLNNEVSEAPVVIRPFRSRRTDLRRAEKRGSNPRLPRARGLAESFDAPPALGADAEAREILRDQVASQHAYGSWLQNRWQGCRLYWSGVRLEEVMKEGPDDD